MTTLEKKDKLERAPMTHVFRFKTRLSGRFGMKCRILSSGRLNNVAIEFEDGFKAVTCRYALRKIIKGEVE